MKLSDFDFNLPTELIAQMPSEKRDHSDLLVAALEPIKTKFYNIIDYLLPGDLLVFNNSKVIKAKLNLGKNITINLNKKLHGNCWAAFAKPARKLHVGDEFTFDKHKVVVVKKLAMGEIELQFELDNITIFEFLDKYGEMPLPLYIKRNKLQANTPLCHTRESGYPEKLKIDSCLYGNDDVLDNDRYQTVYSKVKGSVAAPTAGLHFTNEILDKIKEKGVETAFVTLHVGAGTFMPVKSENIDEHKMHTEYCSITSETAEIINKAKQEGRRIIAVGTTAMRTLESSALQGKIKAGDFETSIFVKPGYKFQMVDMLLTNFHFPKSTLFMLVCAFAGFEEMHKLYKYAIKEKMRFFSYGDATLLYRATI
ncbi:tRNA preQ1(34) S-adenosylmethionine ribosyltransferase-isomerase QueA [Rickettsia endosymbiont of Polydrusus tereticollis]|uniref:tRNA preQ1(34) S-adenosylmethionine ribosyltransferase-isomerase QueA n=1 Tax=Rickettsia endosymbiont of Polydrusus tereticollis TaxID=3066251 RepID=UPI003132B906